MKPAAVCLPVALALAGASAIAQAADDPMDVMRACSTLSHAERSKCLDAAFSRSRAGAHATDDSVRAEGAATPESWVVSETTSPTDYSPVVIATATARAAPDGWGMKLSIACRGGTTSLVLSGPGVLPAGDVFFVSYAVDGGSQTALAAASSASGTGMAVTVDVVRLLVSLPTQGEVTFRIAGRRGVTLEGRYSLAGLKTTRERMAVSCRWPLKPDTPRK